jgi:hypothetical protein
VGGAVSVGDLTGVMKQVGFVEVEFVGNTTVTTSEFTVGGLFRARKRD